MCQEIRVFWEEIYRRPTWLRWSGEFHCFPSFDVCLNDKWSVFQLSHKACITIMLSVLKQTNKSLVSRKKYIQVFSSETIHREAWSHWKHDRRSLVDAKVQTSHRYEPIGSRFQSCVAILTDKKGVHRICFETNSMRIHWTRLKDGHQPPDFGVCMCSEHNRIRCSVAHRMKPTSARIYFSCFRFAGQTRCQRATVKWWKRPLPKETSRLKWTVWGRITFHTPR